MSSHPSGRAVLPSEAVVERVANREGVDPTELEPLYDSVESDALDALVGTSAASGSSIRIEFTYHGHDVTVTGEGGVHLGEPADAPSQTV